MLVYSVEYRHRDRRFYGLVWEVNVHEPPRIVWKSGDFETFAAAEFATLLVQWIGRLSL